jgi:PKD repeat protein
MGALTLLLASCDVGEEGTVNLPPRVDVSVSTEEAQVGTAVTFAADARDPDGSIQSYRWEFGDGGPPDPRRVTSTTRRAPFP